MNGDKTSACLKGEARDFLSGRYMPFIIISMSLLCADILLNYLSSAVYSAFFQFFSSLADKKVLLTTVDFLCSFCASVLLINLLPGLGLFCLKLRSNTPAATSDLFYGYRSNFQKNIAVSAILSLPRLLFLEPFVIQYNLFSSTFNRRYILPAILCLAAGLLICIPLDLIYGVIFFLMHDFPHYAISELISASFRLVRENWRRLLMLELSFLPVIFLCVLSLGIGFLWGIPYIVMTYTNLYLDLMNPSGQSSH